jgi:hypothetical protein
LDAHVNCIPHLQLVCIYLTHMYLTLNMGCVRMYLTLGARALVTCMNQSWSMRS